MIDWRDVRSFEQLDIFLEDFRKLDVIERQEIYSYMEEFLEEALIEEQPIMPRQVEKPLTRPRGRKPRRSRAGRG